MNVKERAAFYAVKKETEDDIAACKHFRSENESEEAYNTGYINGMSEILQRLKNVMGECMKYNAEWETLWGDEY